MALLSRVVFSLIATLALVAALPALAQSTTASYAEDLFSASLATSRLVPDPPELVERTEGPGYISEWITVRWRPDDAIYLYVVRPKKVQKPPVVIYLYEYPAETDIFRDDDWCERVTSGGY